MIALSAHFSLQEATRSSDHPLILNTPTPQILNTMMKSAEEMEKVRIVLGTSIIVNSWYRSPELNSAVGSHANSQHLVGEAIDFVSPSLSVLEICRKLIESAAFIHYDQLILEHTWVHISFAILTGKPRHQVLSLLANKQYAVGLTDVHGNSL